MPFFSIIIPTYNRAGIISTTIKSVVDQQCVDWELIVVDDGGRDNTKKIIEGFNDSRIKYFWKENGERGAARNYGVTKSKGKYVFFLDSDDLIYPNHLEHAFEFLNDLGCPEFFHSRYEEVYTDKVLQIEKLDQDKIWKTIQRQNKMACQFFLRRDIADVHKFSENRNLKIGEDWLVILKIGMKFKLHVSNKVTSGQVQHDDRTMVMANSESILNSRNIILADLFQSDCPDKSKILKNVSFELTSLASLSESLNGSKAKSFLMLIKLFCQNPSKILQERRTLAIIKHLLNWKITK